jgi:hypothetical protein
VVSAVISTHQPNKSPVVKGSNRGHAPTFADGGLLKSDSSARAYSVWKAD